MEDFIMACANGDTQKVIMVLNTRQIPPNIDDDLPLITSCEHGHTEIVGILLATGKVNPAARDDLPLIYACYEGHTEIVRMLLATGKVHPNARDNLPLSSACDMGREECVKLLLETENAGNVTVLENACRYKNVNFVKLLLQPDCGYKFDFILLKTLHDASINNEIKKIIRAYVRRLGEIKIIDKVLIFPRSGRRDKDKKYGKEKNYGSIADYLFKNKKLKSKKKSQKKKL